MIWPKKATAAIATFVVVITVPQFVPQLYNWRVFEWATVPHLLDFHPRKQAASPLEEEQLRMRPDISPIHPEPAKLLNSEENLEHFYESLWRTERKQPGAVTRILHYGDSPTTADMITADTRMLLQEKFGDAGHGTYLIAKPWAWYAHRGFDVVSDGWTINPATLRKEKDGRYGLAGVSFLGQAGAYSRVWMKHPGHTKISLSYLGQPNGGEVVIEAEGVRIGTVDTSMPETMVAQETFSMPSDADRIQLRVTRGTVRLFGFTFRKDDDGIIYDSLGLNGTWAGVLASYVNAKHWAEELRSAKPDLVIINYGTNESGFPNYIDTTYEKDMREVLRRVKSAVPDASVLVMSPMDRGVREKGGNIGTMPGIPKIVAMQAKLAAENECAFFNTFQAMGGPGTMGQWYMAEPRLVSADFIHPMPTGARIVGTLLTQSLLDGYNRFKLRASKDHLAEVRK